MPTPEHSSHLSEHLPTVAEDLARLQKEVEGLQKLSRDERAQKSGYLSQHLETLVKAVDPGTEQSKELTALRQVIELQNPEILQRRLALERFEAFLVGQGVLDGFVQGERADYQLKKAIVEALQRSQTAARNHPLQYISHVDRDGRLRCGNHDIQENFVSTFMKDPLSVMGLENSPAFQKSRKTGYTSPRTREHIHRVGSALNVQMSDKQRKALEALSPIQNRRLRALQRLQQYLIGIGVMQAPDGTNIPLSINSLSSQIVEAMESEFAEGTLGMYMHNGNLYVGYRPEDRSFFDPSRHLNLLSRRVRRMTGSYQRLSPRVLYSGFAKALSMPGNEDAIVKTLSALPSESQATLRTQRVSATDRVHTVLQRFQEVFQAP